MSHQVHHAEGQNSAQDERHRKRDEHDDVALEIAWPEQMSPPLQKADPRQQDGRRDDDARDDQHDNGEFDGCVTH